MFRKKDIILFLTLFLAFGCLSGAAAEKSTNDLVPSVTVRGSAKIELPPDCAYVTFGVANFNVDLNEAQNENNVKAEAVQKSLLASGVDSKLITTAYFNVQPLYNEGNRDKIKGYQVSNEVRVRVDNLALLGTIINRAVVAGANEVSSLRFALRDESEAKADALKQATKNAMKKADVLAEAANKNVVRIIILNEAGVGSDQPIYRNYTAALKMGNALDSAGVPVQTGELTVTAEVLLSCEIN